MKFLFRREKPVYEIHLVEDDMIPRFHSFYKRPLNLSYNPTYIQIWVDGPLYKNVPTSCYWNFANRNFAHSIGSDERTIEKLLRKYSR